LAQAGAQTLRLSASTLADHHFDGTITGFGNDDLIDLKGIGTATTATLGAGNVLTVAGGAGGPVTLQLDPTQSFAGVFGAGFGASVITDFSHGDHIEFDGVFASFADVHAQQAGANTVIYLNGSMDPNHAVTLLGVQASSLHASDFVLR